MNDEQPLEPIEVRAGARFEDRRAEARWPVRAGPARWIARSPRGALDRDLARRRADRPASARGAAVPTHATATPAHPGNRRGREVRSYWSHSHGSESSPLAFPIGARPPAFRVGGRSPTILSFAKPREHDCEPLLSRRAPSAPRVRWCSRAPSLGREARTSGAGRSPSRPAERSFLRHAVGMEPLSRESGSAEPEHPPSRRGLVSRRRPRPWAHDGPPPPPSCRLEPTLAGASPRRSR